MTRGNGVVPRWQSVGGGRRSGVMVALLGLAVAQAVATRTGAGGHPPAPAPAVSARPLRAPAPAPAPEVAPAPVEVGAPAVAPTARRSGRRGVRASYPRGVHPYPRGDEWPAGLTGPFPRQAPFRVRVPSFDGTELDGWIQLPVLPAGVRAPVVLVSSPYYGQTGAPGDVDEMITPRYLVDLGYAVAAFSVRGTGGSGGCFELFGPKEQRDQPVLVEWLAAQPWSNGRVGMYGLSYMGTTPWEAAIQNPPHLKTIVPAGMVADAYNFFHTPQGAAFTAGPAFGAELAALVGVAPPIVGAGGLGSVALGTLTPHVCPEVTAMLGTLTASHVSDTRDPPFWAARRLADRFAGVSAAVLLTHGFQDLWRSGHAFQEDYVWDMLRGPKAMVEGQWAHSFPPHGAWPPTLLGWLDFWLKGIGPPPERLGTVEYQDGSGGWHRSRAWPPAEARAEVFHLGETGLGADPGRAARSLLATPLQAALVGATAGPAATIPEVALCPLVLPGLQPESLLFPAPPAPSPVLIAGNPLALLRLRTTQPGGLVAVHLVDLGPDFACRDGHPVGGHRVLTLGAADLRFHRGDYVGTDFPVGQDVEVRVNLASLAEVVAPGHRLALLVGAGDPIDRTGRIWTPTVDVLPGSHLVVPVVAGTLGGRAPNRTYPPNPFPGSVK